MNPSLPLFAFTYVCTPPLPVPLCCSTPTGVTIVYKGFVLMNDSYSAFGGQDTPPNGRDLKTIIEEAGIQRLWVMGVATDFCVLQSTLDALGKNPNTGRPAPSTLQHVILVEPAARVRVLSIVPALRNKRNCVCCCVSPSHSRIPPLWPPLPLLSHFPTHANWAGAGSKSHLCRCCRDHHGNRGCVHCDSDGPCGCRCPVLQWLVGTGGRVCCPAGVGVHLP